MDKIAVLNPNLNPLATLGYLIQALRGKSRIGYAFKLLLAPNYVPEDEYLDQAKREILAIKRRKSRKNRPKKILSEPVLLTNEFGVLEEINFDIIPEADEWKQIGEQIRQELGLVN